jgi:hypothetical protein
MYRQIDYVTAKRGIIKSFYNFLAFYQYFFLRQVKYSFYRKTELANKPEFSVFVQIMNILYRFVLEKATAVAVTVSGCKGSSLFNVRMKRMDFCLFSKLRRWSRNKKLQRIGICE